jgi:hypothetical protein
MTARAGGCVRFDARMTTRIRLILVALSAVLTLALSGAAAAAPHWEPVRSAVQGFPSAAARDGARTLLVARVNSRIVLTTIAAGRASARTIATGLRGLRGENSPVVLTAPGGSGAVVWEDIVDGQVQVRASLRGSRSSAWTAPRTISVYPAAGFGRVSAAAVGPDGTLLVAWWGGPAGGRLGIYARTWRVGAGWSATQELSGGAFPVVPGGSPGIIAVGAAVGPRGDLAVTWHEPTSSRTARRRLAVRRPGEDWSAPVLLAEGQLPTFAGARLPVAVDGAGRVVAAWLEFPETGRDGVATRTCLHAAVTGVGAPERQELRCVAPTAFGDIRAAADAAGNLMVGWQVGRFTPLRAQIQLAGRPAGAAAWTVPAPLFDEDRGFLYPRALQAAGGGRFLVTVAQGQAVSARDEGLLQVATVDASGTPVPPVLSGPPMPGRERGTDLRLLPFADAPGGVLTWVTVTGGSAKARLAILRP